MKTLKTLFLSIILIFAFSINANAEFFSDIIITSPNAVWTDSRAYSTLNDAIAAVGTNQRTIKIVSPQVVTALTVPANITLEFDRDGSITNSGQLTINTTNIIAPNRQIFTGSGNIDFASGTVVKSGWFANFESALALTTNDTITLKVTKAQSLTASFALGNNVTLSWDSQNILSASAGVTISNIGQVEAGKYQLFAGAGNFHFRDGTIINLDWFANLRAAITHASTNKLTLLVQGTHTVDLSDSIPSTLTTKLIQGGILSISPGITLTINGGIDAGDYQIFSGTGTVAGLTGINEVNAIWFGTYTQATIEAALTAIGTMNKVTLLLQPRTWVIDNDLTITSNILLKLPSGALLQIATGKTLTISGSLESGLYQVFSCADATALVVFGTGSVNEVYPAWWGALGDGSTDDTVAIQAAINSEIKVVEFTKTSSYYKTTTSLTIPSNKEIRLNGATIRGSVASFVFDVAGTTSSSAGWTLSGNGIWKGSTATVTDSTNLAADDMIMFVDPVTSDYDPNIIERISGNTLYLAHPIGRGFTVANGCTIEKITPVENIKILNGVIENPVALGGAVRFTNVKDAIVNGITIQNNIYISATVNTSINVELSNNRLLKCGSAAVGSGLGLRSSKSCKIHDNYVLEQQGDEPIILYKNCVGNIISNNILVGPYAGGGVGGAGIQLHDYMYLNEVIGNTVLNSATIGIYLITYADKNTVTGNTVSHTALSGIELTGTSRYNLVANNNISATATYGITVDSNSVDNKVMHNYISDATLGEIADAATSQTAIHYSRGPFVHSLDSGQLFSTGKAELVRFDKAITSANVWVTVAKLVANTATDNYGGFVEIVFGGYADNIGGFYSVLSAGYSKSSGATGFTIVPLTDSVTANTDLQLIDGGDNITMLIQAKNIATGMLIGRLFIRNLPCPGDYINNSITITAP